MDFCFLTKTVLFTGCSEQDIKEIGQRIGFRTEKYKKGAFIWREGSIVTEVGLVLSGSVRIEHNDLWGNKSILSIESAGNVFAEAYACVPDEPLMIDVAANEDCEILFISVPKLLHAHPACASQDTLIGNLVMIGARKNLQLSRRNLHTSPKTVRGRLVSYFSQLVSAQGSNRVTVPFDRQQLADYLNLDRSALSKELGKLKREGMLEYHKNTFVVKMGKEEK